MGNIKHNIVYYEVLSILTSNRGRAVAIRAPLRMIYMVIHNAKVHKAARTEKGHLLRPNARASFQHTIFGNKCCNLTASHLSSGSNGRRELRLRWLRKWRNHTTIHKATRLSSVSRMKRDRKHQYLQCSRSLFFFEGESIIHVPSTGLNCLRGAGRSA
jgi:hypothetical protein